MMANKCVRQHDVEEKKSLAVRIAYIAYWIVDQLNRDGAIDRLAKLNQTIASHAMVKPLLVMDDEVNFIGDSLLLFATSFHSF